MGMDELDVLHDVTARLEEVGIPYMLTGSMAMNYYAEPRMTRDIDLVVDLEQSEVPRLVQRQPSFYGLNTRSQNSPITARHFERPLERARAASSMTSGPRRCSQRSRDTSEATDAVNLPEAGCRCPWRLLDFAPSEARK